MIYVRSSTLISSLTFNMLKKKTLVTPAPFAFFIWSIIFISQAVFAVAQLHKKFRSRMILQEGISYYFMAYCIFEISWVISFAFEEFLTSVIMMALILLSLLLMQHSISSCARRGGFTEYFLMIFPFRLVTGWILVAFLLNVNVLLVARGSSVGELVAAAIITVTLIYALSFGILFASRKPYFTVAAVLIWGTVSRYLP